MKKYYEDKGYTFTNYGDEFDCKIDDLTESSNYKIPVVCDYCGTEYNKQYKDRSRRIKIFPYKDSCSKCRPLKLNEVRHEENKEKYWSIIDKWSKDKGYKLITQKEDYTNCRMKIKFECPKHGNQSVLLWSIVQRGSGCNLCAAEERGIAQTFTPDQVESIVNSVGNNILLNKEDYTNYKNKNLNILCGTCGKNIFTTSLDIFKNVPVTTCKTCGNRRSKTEVYIAELLDKNNIKYIEQYSFDDCKDIFTLPFDFYLPDYNLCIEFDGEGHYDLQFYTGRCKDKAEFKYNKTQMHDKIKNEYCQDHNIELLRIPYWEKDNIEQIITDKLNELDRRYSLVS